MSWPNWVWVIPSVSCRGIIKELLKDSKLL